MHIIWQSTIIHIGTQAEQALAEHMLITFRDGAPADIADYCFIHQHGELKGTLTSGCMLQLADQYYPVTAVGKVAQENLQQLGHITLHFDGAYQAEYPGCVHVAGNTPQQVAAGSSIRFFM